MIANNWAAIQVITKRIWADMTVMQKHITTKAALTFSIVTRKKEKIQHEKISVTLNS